MPLVLDPERIPLPVLAELLRSLRQDLEETAEIVHPPAERVRDPASLATAAELLESARALLARPSDAGPKEVALRANLAYAVLIAVIDLVKSHTDYPKVPRSRAPAEPKS